MSMDAIGGNTSNSNIEYFVDTKNRVVVAVMKGCYGYASDYIKSILDKYAMGHWNQFYFPSYFVDMMVGKGMKAVYRGVARCAAEDEFDEEKGKEIARARLLTHYYFDLWTTMNNGINMFSDISDALAYRKHKVIDSYCHWFRKRNINGPKSNDDIEDAIDKTFSKQEAINILDFGYDEDDYDEE